MAARLILWAVFLFGGAAGGLYLDRCYAGFTGAGPIFHLVSSVPGLLLLLLVLRASRNTGRWLARYGRKGPLPRMETNRLVTTGYYACMRHPMHFGLLFLPLAFALLIGSPSFIFLIAPAEAGILILLIRLVEEPQAAKKFGGAYLEYRNRVPFFTLRFECLKQLFGPAPLLPKGPDGEQKSPVQRGGRG